jgi:chitodextrinase
MPNITNQPLNVTKVTSDSITITWERWAGSTVNPDPITYKVRLTANDNPYPANYWKTVKEGKCFYTYTFTGLKPNTEYVFNVKAFDESGQVCQYPIANGSSCATTLAPDTEAPTVTNRKLTTTRTTSKTIAIKWEPASDNVTAAKNIRYQAWICEANNKDARWHVDGEGKGITAHTFKNLNPGKDYGIYVLAIDEAGNTLRYPNDKSLIVASTKSPDTQAPTVSNRVITVLEATANQIILRWNPATDNETAAKDIRYEVWFSQTNAASDPWHLAKNEKNITTCTITGLKNKTRYSFIVKAFDESGNVLQYPLDNGCSTVVTDSANSKLVIQKGGSVYCDGLYSTNSKYFLRENMGTKFNRNYFEISFEMYPLATDTDDLKNDNIITISTTYRIFGVFMKKGILQAVVNNDYFNPVDLGFRYAANKWQHVGIVYDNGTLKINGLVTRQIGKLGEKGDNVISNMNYGNGHAFKGYIKDLIVRTK